jgi:diamine N-acetyltransferase
MAISPTEEGGVPTKASKVTLREVTKDNWRAVIELRVVPGQEGSVSPNSASLCEAHYSEDAWVRAIYADETPVGFLMMSIWPPESWYSVWRFMIDARYQRLGFGRLAIRLAISHVRENYPDANLIRLMATGPEGSDKVSSENAPYNFYLGLGFKGIGPIGDDGQIEMGVGL